MSAALVRLVAAVSIATALLAILPCSASAQINGGAGRTDGSSGGGGGGGFGGGTGGAGGGTGGAGGNGTGGSGTGHGGGGAGVGGGGGGCCSGAASIGGPGSGSITTLTNAGTITGGNGGSSSGGGGAGIGGGGGDGAGGSAGGAVGFTIGNNTITNTGTITGGNSGNGGGGGAGIGRGGNARSGGAGGAGLDGITIINSGTIAGGNGGTGASTGGDAINGSSLTVINNGGTITRGTGATAGSAIRFFGGTNSLTLNGGTVTGNVRVDGGTLALTSTGANTITGALTLNAGTTYTVNVTPAGIAGSITTTGAATIAGSVAVQAVNGTYASSATYTILSVTGNLTGTFSGVTSDKAFLTPSLTYDANNVFLTLQFTSSTAFQDGARTPNQRATGAVLDGAAGSANGDFATVISALSGLNTTQGPRALDIISSQPYGNFGTISVYSSMAFVENLVGALDAARGSGPSSQFIGQYAALTGACTGGACDTPAARIGTWISGFGGGGSVLSDGNASGLNYNYGGVAAGADYRIEPNLVVGVSLGFISSRMSTDGLATRGTSNAYTGALYASLSQAGFYVNAVAGYSWNDNRMVRTIEIPGLATRQAVGTPNANQFYGQIEAGYTIAVEGISLTPFVRLQGTTVRQSAFTESGADSLNLSVAAQTTNSLRSTVGAEIAAKVDRVTLGMRLGWQHEYAGTSRPVTASFAGAPGSPFSVVGARPTRDQAVLGLWLDARLGATTTAYARYDGRVGSTTSDHAGSIGLRLTW